MSELERIDAPLAAPVRGFATTRNGGVSAPPYDTFNLGDSTGDAREAVAANRARLRAALPGPPHWLRQVHGSRVIHLDDWVSDIEADAAWTDRPGQVVGILTADCLPVLLADAAGRCVAAAHAGWRGLAGGLLEAVVEALPVSPERLVAWIGPRIGPRAYEVDAPLREAFADHPEAFEATRPGHWKADLPAIAVARLRAAGVGTVVDCGRCTHDEPETFFSHRRASPSGRQAAVAWIEPSDRRSS
ncbi:peptidoglycan editing factor PgeF [Halomonas denitrificans]|nr:peptidoglycan editing factor PgeF [Halomonas denitrificans]